MGDNSYAFAVQVCVSRQLVNNLVVRDWKFDCAGCRPIFGGQGEELAENPRHRPYICAGWDPSSGPSHDAAEHPRCVSDLEKSYCFILAQGVTRCSATSKVCLTPGQELLFVFAPGFHLV
jgi:hypothetical protein